MDQDMHHEDDLPEGDPADWDDKTMIRRFIKDSFKNTPVHQIIDSTLINFYEFFKIKIFGSPEYFHEESRKIPSWITE